MRRLYLQVYLTIVASLVLVVLTAGLLWHFIAGVPPFDQPFEVAGRSRRRACSRRRSRQWPAQQRRSIGWRRVSAPISRCSAPAASRWRPPGDRSRLPSATVAAVDGSGRFAAPAVSVALPDRRWLVARLPPRQRPNPLMLVAVLGAMALAVALGARPIVRRLTGRLERLQHGVESLGAGDLGARVKVEGRDEVARLGRKLQSGRGPHREPNRRPQDAARQCLPRAANAAHPHQARSRAGRGAARAQGGAGDAISRSSISSWMRSCWSAVSTPPSSWMFGRTSTLPRSRPRNARATTIAQCGAVDHGARRPDVAAADDPQSRRECGALRQAADRGHRRAAGRPGRTPGVRSRTSDRRERARAVCSRPFTAFPDAAAQRAPGSALRW